MFTVDVYEELLAPCPAPNRPDLSNPPAGGAGSSTVAAIGESMTYEYRPMFAADPEELERVLRVQAGDGWRLAALTQQVGTAAFPHGLYTIVFERPAQ